MSSHKMYYRHGAVHDVMHTHMTTVWHDSNPARLELGSSLGSAPEGNFQEVILGSDVSQQSLAQPIT